jgi:hypothetical protein
MTDRKSTLAAVQQAMRVVNDEMNEIERFTEAWASGGEYFQALLMNTDYAKLFDAYGHLVKAWRVMSND